MVVGTARIHSNDDNISEQVHCIETENELCYIEANCRKNCYQHDEYF